MNFEMTNWPWYPQYGINLGLYVRSAPSVTGACNYNDFTSYKIFQASNPTEKMLIMDSYQNNADGTSNTEKGYFRIVFRNGSTSSTSFGRPAGRHVKRCNILWLDGHAEGKHVGNAMNPYASKPFVITDNSCYNNIIWFDL